MNPTAVTQSVKGMFAMILKKASILNYKNVQVADLTSSPKLSCPIGHNGEGKINLLDTVHYLSFCRSALNPIDSQVITHSRGFSVLDGLHLNDMGDGGCIHCGMKWGARKRFKCSQKEYKRLSQRIGLIPLIFVSPADIALIDGGSDARRRFLDMVVSQLSHSYVELLSRYNKVSTQRNAPLETEQEPDSTLMEIFE